MPRFLSKKGDAFGGLDCGSHHGTRGAVDAAREVDRHNRAASIIHRFDRGERGPRDRAIKPRAEQRVDDHGGVRQIR